MSNPRASRTDVVTQEVGGEVLLYDRRSGQVHALSTPAAAVWRACSGELSVEEIARETALDLPTVEAALEQLEDCGLIEPGGLRFNRRHLLIGAAATTISLPMITSLTPPALATSASVLTGEVTKAPSSPVSVGTNPVGLAFIPESSSGHGPWLAVASYGADTNALWVFSANESTGALTSVASYTGSEGPYAVAYSPVTQILAVANIGIGHGNDDGYVYSYSVDQTTGALSFLQSYTLPNPGGTPFAPYAIAYHPNGTTVAVSGQTSTIAILSIAVSTGAITPVTTVSLGNNGTTGQSLAFSPDGSLLAASGPYGMPVYKTSNWSLVATFASTAATGNMTGISSGQAAGGVAFTASGNLLVQAPYGVTADESEFTIGAFSVSGSTVTYSNDNTPNPEPGPLAFSPGSLLAVADTFDNALDLYTASGTTLTALSSTPSIATGNGPSAVAFSATGKLIAVANQSDNTVSIYLNGTGK